MKSLVSAFLCFVSAVSFGQLANTDDAVLKKLKKHYNLLETDSLFYMMSGRLQTMATIENIRTQFKQLHDQLGELQRMELLKATEGMTSYKATFGKGKLTMLLHTDADGKLSVFRLVPFQREIAFRKDEGAYDLVTPTGTIHGTIMAPVSSKKTTVVLIIAGSGPTDRDGNSTLGVAGDIYRLIADSLAQAGISSVRYDKRGVGESKGALVNEANLTFDDMLSDALGFLQKLKADNRFSRIILLGHSEGSLISMLCAEREPVDGIISIAGAGEKAGSILVRQLKANSEELANKAKVIVDSLEQGHTVGNIPDGLMSIFHPAVQPYLRSWLKYDPVTEIRKIKKPVLILQGTTDLQIAVANAQMLKKAYPQATLNVINGMNHVLKQAPADRNENIATYSNETLPLSPGLMPEIVGFIQSVN